MEICSGLWMVKGLQWHRIVILINIFFWTTFTPFCIAINLTSHLPLRCKDMVNIRPSLRIESFPHVIFTTFPNAFMWLVSITHIQQRWCNNGRYYDAMFNHPRHQACMSLSIFYLIFYWLPAALFHNSTVQSDSFIFFLLVYFLISPDINSLLCHWLWNCVIKWYSVVERKYRAILLHGYLEDNSNDTI